MRRASIVSVMLGGCSVAFDPKERTPEDTACTLAWYADADHDGYGDPAAGSCDPLAGSVPNTGDCDDHAADVSPDGVEVCDGVDQNCDGVADDGAGTVWYLDGDADGFGNDDLQTVSCDLPDGYTSIGGDCADGDSAIRPDALELCNGYDDDCDGIVDDDAVKGMSTWWADVDFDGFGDATSPLLACTQPDGYADNPDDCNDLSAGSFPGATDGCNGVDDDCDGVTDEDSLPGWFLATIDSATDTVLQVDQATAAVSTLTSLTADVDVNTTDVREDGLSIAHDYIDRTFWEIDACTGAATLIGSTGVGSMCGMAFARSGLLYGLDSENDNLAEFDLDHGTTRVVGALGLDLLTCGLAYDCTTDTLYGASQRTNELFKVDPKTGATSDFQAISGLSFAEVGLVYDPRDASLYAATGTQLFRIDPATGVATLVGSIVARQVDDLSLHQPCP